MAKVELFSGYGYTCDECGIDNFVPQTVKQVLAEQTKTAYMPDGEANEFNVVGTFEVYCALKTHCCRFCNTLNEIEQN